MIRADENMPELTEAEAEEMCRDMEAYDPAFEGMGKPGCEWCHGTGIVCDMVDYGSTTVPMPSVCECVEGDDDDE